MATCAKCGSAFDEATGPCPACLAASAAPPPAASAGKGSSTKVIVVVSLGVFAVLLLFCVGILAAVALPSFITGKSRGQQKRAMSEVRALATAVASFTVDVDAIPDSHGRVVPAAELEALCDEIMQSKTGSSSMFFQDYGKTLATAQADGTPYYYAGNGEHFLLIALGADGKCDADLDATIGAWLGPWPEEGPPVAPRTTSCWENDIVWGDYEFLWVPGPSQSRCGDQGGHDGPPRVGEAD